MFNPHIGEIYSMYFGGKGSEQRGWRPGIVFQNDIGNRYSPNILAIPLTSSLKKVGQPTHVVIRAFDSGLKLDSMALCENMECISKESIGDYITTIPDRYMQEVAVASLLATAAITYLDRDSLLSAWQKANDMNVGILEKEIMRVVSQPP